MADAATSDWSSGSSDWGGGGMWGAPTGGYGMQSPWGGGYGMQSPYGGFGGGYGGFGGGMPYGGGYGMQSPYGAPMGGYGGYSPYGGMSPYGGYGMQSPYSAYGMPQQQSMMAPQTQQQAAADPQTAALEPVPPGSSATASISIPGMPDWMEDIFKAGGGMMSGKQTQTFEPWTPLGNRYEGLWGGKLVDPKDPSKGYVFSGAEQELQRQQGLGPLGFDPSSEAGLARMEQLAGAANPLVGTSRDAVMGIASGDQRINTGGMFGNMYDDPGITGQQQYQDMARRNAIGNDAQYNQMIGRDSIGNAGQYNQIYGEQQGQGSLAGGAYGQIAGGGLMNANPYREKAIADAMNQTSDQVKATMSSKGRYGSDAYGDAMGRALGQVATQARMAGYDTDTANMMAAAQGRSGEALARGGLGLQAAQGLSGMQGTNAAQRLAQIQGLSGIQGQNYQAKLNALGQMNQAQQMANQQRMAAAQGQTSVQGQNLQNRLQAAGMAPQMQQLRYDDASRMLQAGAAREAMAQQQRGFGWDQLQQYRSMLGNLPGAAGQQTQEASQPWWQTLAGVGAGLGGIWGQFGGGGA